MSTKGGCGGVHACHTAHAPSRLSGPATGTRAAPHCPALARSRRRSGVSFSLPPRTTGMLDCVRHMHFAPERLVQTAAYRKHQHDRANRGKLSPSESDPQKWQSHMVRPHRNGTIRVLNFQVPGLSPPVRPSSTATPGPDSRPRLPERLRVPARVPGAGCRAPGLRTLPHTVSSSLVACAPWHGRLG